jgi:ribosome-binding protein aMBF1 (putative translation factor)
MDRPGADREQPKASRVVPIAEALEHNYPILDPLGGRLHYPGEAQYEAWREEAKTMSTPQAPGPDEADLAAIEARWADARPFGEKVREARLARGLSMRALGELVGVSAQYINDIERGARHAREKRAIIAEALGFRHIEPVEHARADVAALIAEVKRLRDAALGG